jgi:hypothetical protein
MMLNITIIASKCANCEVLINDNLKNFTHIKSEFKLFNVDAIGSLWKEISINVRATCVDGMSQYLRGLEKSEIWAKQSER